MTGPETQRPSDGGTGSPVEMAEFGDDVDLLGPLVVLGRARRTLWLWPAIGAALSIAFCLLWPPMYAGTTRMLPPPQNQGAAGALLAQLGGAAGALGGALGVKTPTELYVGMMRSDSVADALIDRFDLLHVYSKHYRVDARKKLESRTDIRAGKDGIIEIRVEDRDRKRAADMANAYVAELHRLTNTLAVSDASQRRLFFEKQLEAAKNQLADAEVALQRAVATSGISSAVGQAGASLETMARLRAQITAKRIQIEAMGAYATESNPDRRRLEQELAAMNGQLAALGGSGPPSEAADSPPGRDAAKSAAGAAPVPRTQNIRLLREVKYHEVLFELLARQYELARLDESKEAPLVQVLDRAVPAEKKSFPRMSIMVPAGAILGLLLAVVVAFARNAYANASVDRDRRRRLDEVRRAWSLRWPRIPAE